MFLQHRLKARRLFFLLSLALISCSPSSEPPRNLVLISIDTLTPWRMSAYGNERRTTPAIDALARESLLFTNSYSTSSWTLPAHASMLTGRYPTSLAPDPNDKGLYRVAPLLSTMFKQKGYRTAAFASTGWVAKRLGFNIGFDDFEEHLVHGAGPAARWIADHRDERFFLFFHTYVVHNAYLDRRYVSPGQGGRISKIFKQFPDPVFKRVCCKAMPLTREEQKFLLALYDGGVAAADEMVDVLIKALSRANLKDRTTIIITSDHGEEFWQHTGRGGHHGHTLYDELLRIPLIWYEAALVTRGEKADAPVAMIDLVPTIVSRFELVGPKRVDGIDISRVLDGKQWRPTRDLFAEGIFHGPARTSIRTPQGKLIWTPDRRQQGEGKKYPVPVRASIEFYLPDDPGEQRNVSKQYPGLRNELMKKLQRHLDQGAGAAPYADSKSISEASKGTLRKLGTLE